MRYEMVNRYHLRLFPAMRRYQLGLATLVTTKFASSAGDACHLTGLDFSLAATRYANDALRWARDASADASANSS